MAGVIYHSTTFAFASVYYSKVAHSRKLEWYSGDSVFIGDRTEKA